MHSDTPMLNDIEAVICDLGNFFVTSYNSFQSPIKQTSLAVPVSGHSVVLGVELQVRFLLSTFLLKYCDGQLVLTSCSIVK